MGNATVQWSADISVAVNSRTAKVFIQLQCNIYICSFEKNIEYYAGVYLHILNYQYFCILIRSRLTLFLDAI